MQGSVAALLGFKGAHPGESNAAVWVECKLQRVRKSPIAKAISELSTHMTEKVGQLGDSKGNGTFFAPPL